MFSSRRLSTAVFPSILLILLSAGVALAQQQAEPRPMAIRGAVRSAPVTPFVWDGDTRDLPAPPVWQPGDPVKEIPRRASTRSRGPKPQFQAVRKRPGPDPLHEFQLD